MVEPRLAESTTIHTRSVMETRQVGVAIGRVLIAGMVVALSGELGAGKTTLTQGIAAGLGIDARVTSPTFMLVNEYEGCGRHVGERMRLIHIDSYRLGDNQDCAASEAATFGFDEVLDDEDAVIVIEWAERLALQLPSDHLKITLEHDDRDVDARRFVITATGPQSHVVLTQIVESVAQPPSSTHQ